MQGINQSKHQHLVDALLQLEGLLNKDFGQDGDKQVASELRSELEKLFGSYNKQMIILADLIDNYHELFNKAKIKFLSPKLKELRKRSNTMPGYCQYLRRISGWCTVPDASRSNSI